MTGRTLTAVLPGRPTTPAAVARAVLDGIAASPATFDMAYWANFATSELAPADEICHTTMCVAGWAAHVTGWTICSTEVPAEVSCTSANGCRHTEFTYLYAERDGERRLIPEVAQHALGLRGSETFWHARPETALRLLEEIARS